MNSLMNSNIVSTSKGVETIFKDANRLLFAPTVIRLQNRDQLDIPSCSRVGRSDESSTLNQRRMAESILHRVAAGDKGAMQQCVDRFGGLVWSLAKRTVPAEAEDAVQDIFLELWKSAQRYTTSLGSETTFVAMIARRRLIDRLRKNESRSRLDSIATQPLPDAATPALSQDASQEMSTAVRAFATLPMEQQRVLRLAVERSMTHEQIALSTGLPLGTVKTHVRRGLMHLRSMLDASRGNASRTPDVEVSPIRRAVS